MVYYLKLFSSHGIYISVSRVEKEHCIRLYSMVLCVQYLNDNTFNLGSRAHNKTWGLKHGTNSINHLYSLAVSIRTVTVNQLSFTSVM